MNRRAFIKRAIYTVIGLEILYLLSSLLVRNKNEKKSSLLFDAGSVSQFEKGKIYPYHSSKFFLHCLADGAFLALSSKCTHLGCTIQFKDNQKKFDCPCHASSFNSVGEVLSAPAVRPLDCYTVTINQQRVMVDLSTPIKRTQYNTSQTARIS